MRNVLHKAYCTEAHGVKDSESGGFTLIELLIVIAILAVLMTAVFVIVVPALGKARDARRKFELANIGRFVITSCPLPDAGAGDYDLAPLVSELKSKFPKYANMLSVTPKDPSRGTEEESFYRYVVTDAVGTSTRKCALYANLENANEPATLGGLSAPSAGGGTGILEAAEPGWNGTRKYFQVSN